MTDAKETTNRVLFVYTTETHTGLAGKAGKIVDGFRKAGFEVDYLYLYGAQSKSKRFIEWIRLNWNFLKLICTRSYSAVYVRYAYYFAVVFLVSKVHGDKIQIEINSNVKAELLKRNQKIRARLNSIVEGIAVSTSRRVHVVSRQLQRQYEASYPAAEIVFNPNFVVEEICLTERARDNAVKINLVFLGNTRQPWHGVEKFIRTVVIDNRWFADKCQLHLIGSCSDATVKLIDQYGLSETVKRHGFLSGEEKVAALQNMDIGIGGFALSTIGLTETTGIKNGEYLHAGLSLILGYVDPSIPPTLPFVLSVNIDDAADARARIQAFVERYRSRPELRQAAHDFARSNLLVEHYISKIVTG